MNDTLDNEQTLGEETFDEQALGEKEQPSQKPALRASTAVLAFFLFLLGQVVASIILVIFAVVKFAGEGGDIESAEFVAKIMAGMMPQLTLCGVLGGGVGLSLAALILRRGLRDRSGQGGAWVSGSSAAMFQSIGLGVAAAFFYLSFPLFFMPPPVGAEVGPLAKMATQGGIGQIIWVITAVILAPPIEELLFRGIILGGLNRSWGIVWGVVICNLLFVLTHIAELIHYIPAFAGLTLLSLIATRQRLTYQAIGPAIAAHVGYNGTLAVTLLFS